MSLDIWMCLGAAGLPCVAEQMPAWRLVNFSSVISSLVECCSRRRRTHRGCTATQSHHPERHSEWSQTIVIWKWINIKYLFVWNCKKFDSWFTQVISNHSSPSVCPGLPPPSSQSSSVRPPQSNSWFQSASRSIWSSGGKDTHKGSAGSQQLTLSAAIEINHTNVSTYMWSVFKTN